MINIYVPENINWAELLWSNTNMYIPNIPNGYLKSDNYVWYLIPRYGRNNFPAVRWRG
jgi:hypothetical protein